MARDIKIKYKISKILEILSTKSKLSTFLSLCESMKFTTDYWVINV